MRCGLWVVLSVGVIGCSNAPPELPLGPASDGDAHCRVPAYLEGASLTSAAQMSNQFENPGYSLISLGGAIDDEATVELSLWEGAAAFSAGFQTGAYALAGKETAIQSCGICLVIRGDEDNIAREEEWYMPYWGVVAVRELDPTAHGRVSMTMEDLRFRQVKWDALGNQVDVEGGCLLAIDLINVNAPIQ